MFRISFCLAKKKKKKKKILLFKKNKNNSFFFFIRNEKYQLFTYYKKVDELVIANS